MFKKGDVVYYLGETYQFSCGRIVKHQSYVVTDVYKWTLNPNHPPKLLLKGFEDFTWNGANFTLENPDKDKPSKKLGKQAAKEKVMERKPHKHAAIIKAWADGAIIQVKPDDLGHGWVDVVNNNPTWSTKCDYRVKPEKKDDIIQYFNVAPQMINLSLKQYANARFTFDGETGKLKAVELI